MASTKPKVRNFYIIGTIAVVLLFFANYFFAYIPSKTDKMIGQGIRIMQRMGKNIQAKEVHYTSTIANYSKNYDCILELNEILDNSYNDQMTFYEDLYWSDCFYDNYQPMFLEFENILLVADSLEISQSDTIGGYSFLHFADSLFNEVMFFDRLRKSFQFDENIKVIDRSERHSYLFTVDESDESSSTNKYERSAKNNIRQNDDATTNKRVTFAITAEDFLEGVKRFEFFDDIFLVDPATGALLDKSKNDIQYFDHNSLEKGENTTGDSILVVDNKAGFSGVAIGQKEVSHTRYYVYTHIVEIQGNQYLLTALKSKSKFRSEVREVSVWTVMISVILLLILVQILPIIKPFLLSKKESLNGTDLVWASISVVFGVSAMALFALGTDTFLVEEIDLVDQKLEQYSDSIKTKFEQETKLTINALELMESCYLQADTIGDSTAQYLLSELLHSDKMTLSFLEIRPNGKTSDYFTVDKQLNKVTKQQLDLNRREYFKAHYGERLKSIWKIPEDYQPLNTIMDTALANQPQLGEAVEELPTTQQNETGNDSIEFATNAQDSNDSYAEMLTESGTGVEQHKISLNYAPFQSYFIESIFSMANGKYQTTVSVKNEKDLVLALVLPFQSVNNRYLEPKYSFCVINKEGEIQYHTNQNRIKNENFFDEVNKDPDVMAFVKNDADTSLDISFAQKDYRAHISSVPYTDWNIVTLYELKNSRLIITSTLSVVFQFVLATLIYLLLLHALLRVTTKRNALSKHTFAYNFLNPLLRPYQYYWELLAINAGVILSLIAVYKSNELNLAFNFTIYFATITATILYNYLVLAGNEKNDGDTRPGWVESKWFVRILVLLTCIWLIFFGIALNRSFESWGHVVFALPVIALLVMSFLEKTKDRKADVLDEYTEKHIVPFYLHNLSWIIVLAIIPTLLFFKPVYNYQHIWRTADNLSSEVDTRISTQDWNSNRIELFKAENGNYKPVHLNKLTERLIEGLTFYFDNEGSDLNGLNKSTNVSKNAGASRMDICKAEDDGDPFFEVTYNSGKPYLNEQEVKPATIIAFSLPRVWHSDLKVHAWIFWILVSIVLIVLYISISKITQKFFYIDLTRTLRGMLLQQQAKSLGELFKDIKSNELLLVGIPYSGRNALALELVKPEKKKPLVLDFMEGKESVDGKLKSADLSGPVIVNNLDYSIDDIEFSKFKLGVIEKIQTYRSEHKINSRFILISGKDTYQLLDVYDVMIKSLKKKNDEDAVKRITDKRILIDRWESALYAFSKHIVPIKLSDAKELIAREIGNNPVLMQYKNRLENIRADLDEHAQYLTDEEKDLKVISTLLDMAENYYFAIWNSCSREEKFLLADLANDGVLNSSNSKAIYSLVRKGILVLRPKLEIFNYSFRLFILESVGEEEIVSIETEARAQGNWKSYQYLVIFLVIVVVIFLSLAEEKAVAQITSVVSLGAVVFPKIVQIFSAFASRKNGTG